MPINGLRLSCLQVLLAQRSFSVSCKESDQATGSRNIKPEVVFKVQKMARYALFCLIMGPIKGKVPVFARLWPIGVKVRVSFTTGAVRSAILATAGLLVNLFSGSALISVVNDIRTFPLDIPSEFSASCYKCLDIPHPDDWIVSGYRASDL